mgnify:CR=1 FL=1
MIVYLVNDIGTIKESIDLYDHFCTLAPEGQVMGICLMMKSIIQHFTGEQVRYNRCKIIYL